MNCSIRSLYSRGNLLLRKFINCSEDVKVSLFRSYMTPIYCCHLWTNYTRRELSRVKVAYNNIFRRLFHISPFESISLNMVARRLPTVSEIIRKNTFSLYSRFSASANCIAGDASDPYSFVSYIGTNFWSRFL